MPDSYLVMHYLRVGVHRYTFQTQSVRDFVVSHALNPVLNLFAGHTVLDELREYRVDTDPNAPMIDWKGTAHTFLDHALDTGLLFNSIIYDPPWNQRKSKEFYNGRLVGKFTLLKNKITKVLRIGGVIISVGYEITNFGRLRGFDLEEVVTVDPCGEQRPYFISVERKVADLELKDLKPDRQKTLDTFSYISS